MVIDRSSVNYSSRNWIEATQGTRGLLALPGIEYERSEAPSGARWSVSEISLEIEAAEPPDGGGSRNRHSP